MSNEVNQEHIREAHDARIKALDHYERTQEFQDRENFIAVETHISPRLYDSELDWLHRNICEGTGRWLQKERAFCRWLDPADASTRLIWLQGIPGAGMYCIFNVIVREYICQWLVRSCSFNVARSEILHICATVSNAGSE
jgi:hypothetical protein